MGFRIRLLFFLCLECFFTHAQSLSNKRSLWIATKGQISLNTNSIIPNSVSVSGVDSSFYTVDYVNGILTWKKVPSMSFTWVHFRIFPYRLNAVRRRFSYDSIQNITVTERRLLPDRQQSQDNFFNFGNINYNGSFGRSISFGNSQDAVFNSQFNLQMEGYIGDSIHLAAAITDNNIPIQPDGTTQQLNQFDQVLIQFRKKNWEASLGDLDVRQNQNYFINFYKRLEGLTFSQQSNFGHNITSKTVVSGAIAKGKFAKNLLTLTNGNQGPYQLTGNNNETYLVVLAGTEKVYMDGVLLQRGQDQDYVINYNTGLITFTSKNLISSDKRIQVDFEYSDRNYLNSLMYVGNETSFGDKVKLNIAAYSNSDAKNSTINQDLTTNQKQFLADIGDSVSQAFYQGSISAQSFDATLIMYQKIDTIANGVHDSIYVYSTDSLVAKYAPTFVSVGAGKGDYILLNNSSNGKSYRWIAPVDGVRQGSYVPAEFLVTPKKQQIVTANVIYQVDHKNQLQAQIAASKYDINTFSAKDKGNDNGKGIKLNYLHHDQFSYKNHKYDMAIEGSYEQVDSSFQPVERLRSVEFTREWGLPLLTTQESEKLIGSSFSIKNEKNDQFNYVIGSYTRGDGYNGFRNKLTYQQSTADGWQLNGLLNYTKMKMPEETGFYLKPTVEISKTLKSFHNYNVGVSYIQEKSQLKYITDVDSIDYQSYAYETYSAFIKSDISKLNNWTLSFYTRTDWLPDSTLLKKTTKSNNISFTGQLLSNAYNKFKINMTYRQLSVFDTTLTSSSPEKTLLGRIEYAFNTKKNVFSGNVLYEIGSGQEPEREFTYVKVNNGIGQYTWIDYNNDGVAQLNEFELSAFKDQANYIRVYTSSGNYIKANYTQLNYSFSLVPANAIDATAKGFKKVIRNTNLQSSLQTSKKVVNGGTFVLNPFRGGVSDTSLLLLDYIWSSTFSYNRSSIVWGVDLTHLLNYDKALLTYGSESTQSNQWTLKERVNLGRKLTVSFQQMLGANDLTNHSYGNRNYALNKISLSPTLTFTSSSRFRVSANYQYESNKNEEIYGGEKAISNALTLSTKLNTFQSTSLSGSFTYNQISFNGEESSTVGYTMLNGLVTGKNYLWNLNFTKRFMRNLEFTMQYNGRKPAASKIVHIGTVTIRAVL